MGPEETVSGGAEVVSMVEAGGGEGLGVRGLAGFQPMGSASPRVGGGVRLRAWAGSRGVTGGVYGRGAASGAVP